MTCSRDRIEVTGWISGSAIVALLMALPALPARAQDADQLFREGVALREAGDTVGAIDRLRRAHGVDPGPRITYNLAAALADRGHYVEARFLLRRLVTQSDVDLLIADAARGLLERVVSEIATVRITVADAPAARRVVVDGTRDVETGRDIALDPGAHRIEVRAHGGTVLARSDVDLAPGQRADIVLRPVSVVATASGLSGPADSADAAATRVGAPSGGDDTWLWVGVGAGVVLVVAAVVTGTAIALSGQGGGTIDGDLEDVHVRGGR